MRKPIIFSAKQEDRIIGMYLEGKTARWIANQIGVSDPIVQRVLHKHGVEIDYKRGKDYRSKEAE